MNIEQLATTLKQKQAREREVRAAGGDYKNDPEVKRLQALLDEYARSRGV